MGAFLDGREIVVFLRPASSRSELILLANACVLRMEQFMRLVIA